MTTAVLYFPKEKSGRRLERHCAEMRKHELDCVLVGVVDALLRNGIIASGLRATYDNITGHTPCFYSQQPIKSSDFTRAFSWCYDRKLEADLVSYKYTRECGPAFDESVPVDREGAHRLTQSPRVLFESRPLFRRFPTEHKSSSQLHGGSIHGPR